MNTTPSHFLVFDPAEQKWIETNLDELAMRDDPELYITPIFENGEQGKQCTWKEYQFQQKALELSKKQKREQAEKETKRNHEDLKKQNFNKRQEEAEAFKKKMEEESREVMATCIRTILENIEAMKADQLETNKKVRAVCSIFLICSFIASLSAIMSFLK